MKFTINLNHQLCFQIAKTHQLYSRFYKRPLHHFQLTYAQYVVLLALWEKDQITVNQLSTRVGLNNGTLTPLLQRLQRDGWVNRTHDKRDHRKVIITLTQKGKQQKNAVLSATQNCLVSLNYSTAEYQQAMKNVLDIQHRLQKSLISHH